MTIVSPVPFTRPRFGSTESKPLLKDEVVDTLGLEYGQTVGNFCFLNGEHERGITEQQTALRLSEAIGRNPQIYDDSDARGDLIEWLTRRAGVVKSLKIPDGAPVEQTRKNLQALARKLNDLATRLGNPEEKLAPKAK